MMAKRPDTYESEFVAVDSLKPWPRNYKDHCDQQVQALGGSLRNFGQFKNVVVWGDYIIAGHGLIDAARSNGYDEVEVKRLPNHFTEAMVEAVLVADNELPRLAEDDTEQLADLLESIRREDAALLDSVGWDSDELDELLRELGGDVGMEGADTEPELDRAEELRAEWGVELDQCWQIGPHKIICGDCTDPAVVERLMGGERADMIFTDPPYNVASESKNFAAGVSSSMEALRVAEWDKDFDLRPALDVMLSIMAEDASAYICTSHFLASMVWEWMSDWSTHYLWCIWHKPNPMPSLSKRHWTGDAELIAYATRGKHIFNFPDDGHAPSVWSIPKSKMTSHPTEKPVLVPENAVRHSSKRDQTIFDPFCGSGTTIIACHNLSRICRAAEISPAYVAVCLQRYADHTGIQPELME